MGCRVGAEDFWVCAHVKEGPEVGMRRLVVCAFVLRLKHLTTFHAGVGLPFPGQGLADSDLFDA